jgi:hypothetical protein
MGVLLNAVLVFSRSYFAGKEQGFQEKTVEEKKSGIW